jgi:hypothetical protein
MEWLKVKTWVQAPVLQKKVTLEVCWCTPVIPATQEAELGVSPSETSTGKSTRSYLRNQLKVKGLGPGSRGKAPPNKHEALSSIPRTEKKRHKKFHLQKISSF